MHDARFFRAVLAGGTLGFGESYMDGWWDCDALDEMCCRAIRARLEERVPVNLHTALAFASSFLLNLQTRSRSRLVGKRHYDVGNELFECMLDPSMQYSCAWFRDTNDLAQAQREKMDLICRKLGLEKGMSLLDIGCGWGGLARHASEHYGCRVVGITISEEQRRYGAELSRGLPVEIRLQDYREISEQFDRVVSVGMLEHVGPKNYRKYMRKVFETLRPGGVFVCQSIAANFSSLSPGPVGGSLHFSELHDPIRRAGEQGKRKIAHPGGCPESWWRLRKNAEGLGEQLPALVASFCESLWRDLLPDVALLSPVLRRRVPREKPATLSVRLFQGRQQVPSVAHRMATSGRVRSGALAALG